MQPGEEEATSVASAEIVVGNDSEKGNKTAGISGGGTLHLERSMRDFNTLSVIDMALRESFKFEIHTKVCFTVWQKEERHSATFRLL